MSDRDGKEEIEDRPRRPPRAVVGSHRPEDEMFGKAYDGRVVQRIWRFVHPYRGRMAIAVVAVLVFSLTQLALPLTIRFAIDNGMQLGEAGRPALALATAAFALAILINYGASYVQEIVVGRVAESVLSDMRRAMFAHLQRVSLSFMDRTEVGRLMSRLQGDVGSMQEFLETSVLSVGDIALLFGIDAGRFGRPDDGGPR
jgi:ATP-binding cassette subfamily B protein